MGKAKKSVVVKAKVNVPKIGVSNSLQSPNNKWITQSDASLYKVPETSNGVPTKGSLIGRISKVNANLVFVRFGKNMQQFLRTDMKAPFNYIDVNESKAIPYHLYILNNQAEYSKSNPELVSWAKDVANGNPSALASNPPISKTASSFDGDDDNNTDDDSNDEDANSLDLGGASLLDEEILSKFSGNSIQSHHANHGVRRRGVSHFSGGAMPDFNGGDTFAFTSNTGLDLGCDGSSNFVSNSNLDLSFSGESNVCGDGYAISNKNIDLGIDGRVHHFNKGRHLGHVSNFTSNVGLDLGIDGSSTPSDIKAFQSWYNKNKKGTLAVDGKWGPKTSSAWNISKADYAKVSPPKQNTVGAPLPKYLLTPQPLTADQAKALTDPNKVVYTEEEAEKLYQASGSKQKFSDWVKSDNAKSLFSSLGTFGQNWLLKQSQKNAGSSPPIDNGGGNGGGNTTTDSTIFGMHPLNFGLLLAGSAVVVTVGIFLFNAHKHKLASMVSTA